MDLNSLIAECIAYDFKVMLEEKKPKSWLKSVSAFANGLGGSLLFGIDNDAVINGLDDVQHVCETISSKISDYMDPLPEADDASARISAVTTGVEGVYSGVCAYAEGQSIVVEATDAGKAQIVRPNGVMQEVKVNVGRNTYPMADGGIYFIRFAGKTFKVII